MYDLTGFQRDLLYVIAGADHPSGQDIKTEVGTDYSTDINHDRLYPTLDTLANTDFVEKDQHDRPTNHYELTDTGETRILERQVWD